MPSDVLSFEEWSQIRAYVAMCGQFGITRDDLAHMAELDRLRFDKLLSGEEISDHSGAVQIVRALSTIQDRARSPEAVKARERLEHMIAKANRGRA